MSDSASFLEAMHAYFAGEKALGWLLVPIGLALLGFSIWVGRTEAGGFRWGLAWPKNCRAWPRSTPIGCGSRWRGRRSSRSA